MFRLVNYSDDGVGGLYRYLTGTASKVIWNALNIWAGSVPAILEIYLDEFAGSPIGESDVDFFEGISKYISPDIVRPEINDAAERVKIGRSHISVDGRIGMELLARKTARMKDKMADPVHFYTFDLFEEFLFAKMLDSYNPEIFKVEEDPYVITTDEEVAESARKLLVEFRVGEDLEAELGESGIGKEYANWLARTIHRVDQMDLWASEEAGFDSLYFWDADYELVFDGTFLEGIKGLTEGTAAIMGYGYENVKEIFTDIGLKAPLLLIGTEAAFDAVEEATQKKIAKAMGEMAEVLEPAEESVRKTDGEDDLPFK